MHVLYLPNVVLLALRIDLKPLLSDAILERQTRSKKY